MKLLFSVDNIYHLKPMIDSTFIVIYLYIFIVIELKVC